MSRHRDPAAIGRPAWYVIWPWETDWRVLLIHAGHLEVRVRWSRW